MPLKSGRKNSWASVILIIVLLVALLVVKTCRRTTAYQQPTAAPAGTAEKGRGLNRNPAGISYSKHARCRMDCRHISEAEVKDILATGKINYAKSDLSAADCKKRYAVEGTTADNQKVRIIFAPCQAEETVVTVIDIGKEWACDCQ